MRMHPFTVHGIGLLLLLAAAPACSGSAPSAEPDDVLFEDSLTDEDRQNLVPGPRPPAATEDESMRRVGEDSVEVAQLRLREPYVTAGRLRVTLLEKTQTPDGLFVAWQFEHDERQAQVEHRGTSFYYEGRVFDWLYSLDLVGDELMFTVHGKAPAAPIDVATAARIATPELRERLECDEGQRVIVVGDVNGTIKVQSIRGEDMDNPDVVCTVRVGLYTERIVE